MKQVARNLTDMWDGFLLGKRYLIHDRDPLFTEAVRGLLRDSGVKPLRLPANSPNLNAYAERFVLSIRRECLDRFVPLSERHLRTAITEGNYQFMLTRGGGLRCRFSCVQNEDMVACFPFTQSALLGSPRQIIRGI